jgi:hypothetical protein
MAAAHTTAGPPGLDLTKGIPAKELAPPSQITAGELPAGVGPIRERWSFDWCRGFVCQWRVAVGRQYLAITAIFDLRDDALIIDLQKRHCRLELIRKVREHFRATS